jgi:ABC-2 type transport system ATP-binding protein
MRGRRYEIPTSQLAKTSPDRGVPDPLIAVEALTKRYGERTAVDSICFDVQPGEIFGFLGPNGAGKTTTIKLLTGLVRPTSGCARIGGFDILERPVEAKRIIGYVPDEPNLYGKLSALEFLNFVADVYDVEPSRRGQRIADLLELFELGPAAGDLIEGYSHGMKQKVALCAALLHEPAAYFLDEPTVGLDPRGARTLKDILRRAVRAGSAVFMSTHIMEIAQALCDRVAIIDRGKIAAVGTPGELAAMLGGSSLEDTFLHLTGATEDRLIAEIFEAGE